MSLPSLARLALPSPPRAALLAPLAGAVIALLFWPAFTFGFFSDDGVYLLDNSILRNLPFWRLLVERGNSYEFLPLRDMSYWLEWRLFGANPLPYHLVSLAWYGAACAAAAFAARELAALHRPGRPVDPWLPLAAAALFLVHPLHLEPVVWVAGRKDLMAGTFIFLAAGCWARGLARQEAGACWLAMAAYVLALCSKTPVVVFPAIAALLWLGWEKDKASPRSLATLGLLLLAGAGGACFALAAGADSDVTLTSREGLSAFARILIPLRALGAAAIKTLVPVDLRFIYDQLFVTVTPGLDLYGVAGGVLLLATAAALGIYLRRRALGALCLVWFVLFLLPTTQIIPFRSTSIFSDRFAFTSSFGAALLAAGALQAHGGAYRHRLLAGALAVLAALTLVRAADWRSAEILLTREAASARGASGPQVALITNVYLPAGRFAEAMAAAGRTADPVQRRILEITIDNRRLAQAGDIRAWRRFLAETVAGQGEILVGDMEAAGEMASACLQVGLLDQAETLYRAMAGARNYPARVQADLEHNLALVLERKGQVAEALKLYYQAAASPRRLPSSRAMSWNNIGALHNALQEPERAEAAFLQAVALDPGHEFAALNLAKLYLRQGRREELDALLAGPAGKLPRLRTAFPGT